MDSNAISPWVGLSKGLRKSQSSQLEQLLVSCWLQPQQKSAGNSAGSCCSRSGNVGDPQPVRWDG